MSVRKDELEVLGAQPVLAAAERRAMTARLGGVGTAVLPLVSVAVAILLWWVIAVASDVPEYLVPTPDRVLETIAANREELFSGLFATAKAAVIGLALAVAIGVPVGLAMGRWFWVRETLLPPVLAIQSVPKIAIAPIFIAWLGLEMLPKVVITFIITVFPILLAGMLGVQRVPRDTHFLTRSMGLRGPKLAWKVMLPYAAPDLAGAFQVATSLALIGSLTAEFVGSVDGIGAILLRALGVQDTPLAFGAILLVGLAGALLYLGASLLIRLIGLAFSPGYLGSTT